MLPKLAEGEANKVFVIPSEFTQAFAGIGDALRKPDSDPPPELPSGGDGSAVAGDPSLSSDTPVEDLLRDSPLAGDSALAGVATKLEDVLAAGGAATGEEPAAPSGAGSDNGS